MASGSLRLTGYERTLWLTAVWIEIYILPIGNKLSVSMKLSERNKSVGRPRGFEEERVLEAVMNTFWEKGYEGTSFKDLFEATGLHKASLYQAFGDKHQLFLKALGFYIEQTFKEVAASAYSSDSPMENLRSLLSGINTLCLKGNGCMLLNSLVEVAPHDPDVKEMIERSHTIKKRFLADMIDKAQRSGEITTEQDPERLAAILMVALAGVAATVKGFSGADHTSQVLEDILASWV
ncbi:TetR/AcrR family transcriptional regulator [Porticoccus litoralis]|uniref:TetR/AcrR family transcriptional regulator n=1 Tax=Porticoccus litoralis TaxID=434086 RepID=A0AAW8B2A4_9GAMM|nr:TetR/AcrR family transcriptional regulator [Porticoccus litoralis]MDP1519879.1 TetR/AcrR family transcriptional regulator [Porticoccus litoralis]